MSNFKFIIELRIKESCMKHAAEWITIWRSTVFLEKGVVPTIDDGLYFYARLFPDNHDQPCPTSRFYMA